MGTILLTKTTTQGDVVEVAFANEKNLLLNVSLNGEFVTEAGQPKKLRPATKGCTHWVGEAKTGKAFGLTDAETETIQDHLKSRGDQMSEARQAKKLAKKEADKKELFEQAKKFEVPEGMQVAVLVDVVTGGDDGWGEGTSNFWCVYELADGTRTGFDKETMVVLETCGWDNRPQIIAIPDGESIDVDQIANEDRETSRKNAPAESLLTQAEEKAATDLIEDLTEPVDHPGYCNRCKSYCYGDCTASNY